MSGPRTRCAASTALLHELGGAEHRRVLRELGDARERRWPWRRSAGRTITTATNQGDAARAVRLAAGAHAEQHPIGKGTDQWWRGMQQRLLGDARAQLSAEELEHAERAGRETHFNAVLDEALAESS